ncbi:MAG: hypothetical protein FWH08_05250 [Oscillospiraceae bacterium]|nr:hypothetical protein [Oscillospiraceae bacterium]
MRIIDAVDKTVSAHMLKDGEYIVNAYGVEDETVSVQILNGCTINLKDVFPY